MSVGLLGLKPTGGSGNYAQFQRYVDGSATTFGETFATILTTGAPSGTFTAGETLNFSGGGTAVLAEPLKTSPFRLIIASPSGTISGTITGASSGASATVSVVEGAYTLSGSTNYWACPALEFNGAAFCLHGNTIYRLNETLGVSGGRAVEAYRMTTTRSTYLSDSALNIGLFSVNVGGVPTMLALYSPSAGGGTMRRCRSSDGITWTEAQVSAANPYNPQGGPGWVIDNVIYTVGTTSGGGAGVYDPASDTFSALSGGAFVVERGWIIGWRGRVFGLGDTGTLILYELIAGAWTAVASGGSGGTSSRSFAVPGNDGCFYAIRPRNSGGGTPGGFTADRIQIFPTLAINDLSIGCLPSGVLRATSPTVNGWVGEIYTDKEFNGATVDNGKSETFWWVSTSNGSGTPRSVYKWDDDSPRQHTDCLLATDAALPAFTSAGSGSGQTLTANVNGALTVDSGTPTLGSRILVKNDGVFNGIYSVTALGSVSTPWVLTRATDFDTVATGEVETGAWVFITNGTNNFQYRYVLTTAGTIILNTTPLTFTLTPIMVLQSSGVPQDVRTAISVAGGGEYSYTSGEVGPARSGSPVRIIGGRRYSFRLYKKAGSANIPNVKVRLLYRLRTDVTQGNTPGRWAYISASSHGTVVGNREIQGLTADSEFGTPGTTYTLDWGFLAGDLIPNFSAAYLDIAAYV